MTEPSVLPLAAPAVGSPGSSPPARRIRRTSWLDLRVVTGVVLVLASVFLGARVVSAADASVRVWAVSRDLAAGTTLAADDLRPVRVRLVTDADRYVRASAALTGRTLTRSVGAGELLPRSALTSSPQGRLISLPVPLMHAPAALRRGQLIDVFATTKSATGNAGSTTERVLAGVPVQEVRPPSSGLSGGGADLAIVVRVRPEFVQRLVTAIRTSEIDVAIVIGAAGAPVGGAPAVAPSPSSRQGPV
ncbi:MAG: SAF domain-containing protein, partial [Mycobacteriales bacterium]